MESLLGGELDFLYSYLEENYNDGKNCILHYTSAREVYNIIKALENEETKDNFIVNEYRNYKLRAVFDENSYQV